MVQRTTDALNSQAHRNKGKFLGHTGTKLEPIVCDELRKQAVGTEFDGGIELTKPQAFPDIIANGYFGVEVKSTKQNSWKSQGSSIEEGTRIQGIERIFMLFGKINAASVEFKSKPYEDCLDDIAVTHSPRYKIDMEIQESHKQTIFEKMGIDYDDFRLSDNKIEYIKKYYGSKLKTGESTWWMGNGSTSPIIKTWTALTHEEKIETVSECMARFPEVIYERGTEKYTRAAVWMTTDKSIICTNIRDGFSAGGKEKIFDIEVPQAYAKVFKYREEIKKAINEMTEEDFENCWGEAPIGDPVNKWIEIVSSNSSDSVKYEGYLKRVMSR